MVVRFKIHFLNKIQFSHCPYHRSCLYSGQFTQHTDDYYFRCSRPEVFLRRGVLKICRKVTGVHPYRSAISIKLLALRHGCSTVNLLHILRIPFPRNTPVRLFLYLLIIIKGICKESRVQIYLQKFAMPKNVVCEQCQKFEKQPFVNFLPNRCS